MDMENLSSYEMMVIVHPGIGDAKTKEELDEIRKLISANGGEVFSEDLWGLRDMSYRIRKENEGYYAVFNFRLEPVKITVLEKALSIQNAILRFIVIKTPRNYEIKTLEQYTEEAEKELLEKKEKEKEKDETRKEERAVRKPVERVERVAKVEKVEKTEKKVEKKEEEEKPKKAAPSKKIDDSRDKLSEMDDKLKSIIDDPDMLI